MKRVKWIITISITTITKASLSKESVSLYHYSSILLCYTVGSRNASRGNTPAMPRARRAAHPISHADASKIGAGKNRIHHRLILRIDQRVVPVEAWHGLVMRHH